MKSTTSLYAITVLIWGSTWLAIHYQLGIVPPMVSIVWRFVLASAILFAYARWKEMKLNSSPREHAWVALQGLLLVGLNYIGAYTAEIYLPSGLVAVAFSLIVFFNIAGTHVFFGAPVNLMLWLAAALGVAGIALLFSPEFADVSRSGASLLGLGIAIAGTLSASLGSIVAARNQRHGLEVVPLNAWSMLYGTIFMAALAVIAGNQFVFDASFAYVVSLLYLAIPGSVIAFGTFLTLLKRIGADRAGYVSVLIPVVALILSTLFEHLQWQGPMFVGLALCLIGNVLMLKRTPAPALTANEPAVLDAPQPKAPV
jgi:drug/metabolite transporter (DMT)-like permease